MVWLILAAVVVVSAGAGLVGWRAAYARTERSLADALVRSENARKQADVRLQRNDPAVRTLDGGASLVRVDSSSIHGDSADIVAEVDEWLKSEDRRPDGSWFVYAPHNVLVVNGHLVRSAGGVWRVT